MFDPINMAFFNLRPSTIAPLKLVLDRLAFSKFAYFRFALEKLAPLNSTFEKLE
jgi:hypothetical protein